jgi:hypothetical protein|tara:strand:+ start:375 stop:725 length:351 start_codon:yes stop_codon:yes gene_type:complete
MARIITAIQLIKPDANCSVSGDDINNIKWYDGNPENITAAQIESKLAEADLKISFQELRDKRNNLLTKSDWTVLPDSPIADKTAWQTYRQELRDITSGLTTIEDIKAVTWPTKPGA